MAVSRVGVADLAANIFKDTVSANAAVVVKASSTVVYAIEIDNTANAAASFVKLWNNAGAVTVGTTAPEEIILVPASSTVTLIYIRGKTFGTGLQVATVTAAGTAGTTSPTSSVIVEIAYT